MPSAPGPDGAASCLRHAIRLAKATTEENENAYGITTRSFWVKDAVYQDFIKEYFDGDPNRALGEEIMVSCDFNGKPNRLLPYSLFK